MTIVQTNEFRTGMKIIIDNNLCEIIDHQFHKPGKGQAVMRVKYKNLSTSQVLDKTFKTGETVEKADIEISKMQFLYSQEDQLVFMNSETFEQTNVEKKLIEEKKFSNSFSTPHILINSTLYILDDNAKLFAFE